MISERSVESVSCVNSFLIENLKLLYCSTAVLNPLIKLVEEKKLSRCQKHDYGGEAINNACFSPRARMVLLG